MISLQTIGGDCDVYAKAGAVPSRVNYDASDTGTKANFTLTIQDPGVATWYVGIYGWTTCSFTITFYETSACPAGCSLHGTCMSNGFCSCQNGWSGLACDQTSLTLNSNVVKTGNITGNTGAWNYYTFSVVNSTSIHIALDEISSDGWLWLFFGKQPPTLRNYDYADTETNTGNHRISVQFDTEQTQTFYVGVYANPFSLGYNIQYQIIAWAPSF